MWPDRWKPWRTKKQGTDDSVRGQLRLDSQRFSGEGPETEATRIVDQILARLGPELRQSRDPKRRPPTPGPECIRSVERETSAAPSKDSSKNKGPEKTGERIGDAHPRRIGANLETEKGRPNVTSVRDMDTS